MDSTMDKQPLTFMTFSKKTKTSKNTVTKIIVLVLIAIVFCYLLLLISNYYYFENENLPQKTGQKCFCRWKNKSFNVCYKMPFAPTLEGEPFSCKYLPLMKNLSLLDFNNKNIFVSSNSPQIVTAFSSTYFIKGLNMIAEYRKIVPRDRIIVYDIGLTQNQSQMLSNICNVVVEKFDFNDFPKYVRILTHYRWKPIVITKALQKYGSIIYVDSSVHFRNTNYLRIPSLVNCRRNQNDDDDDDDDVRCTHFPYMLHSYAGHSIHYATMTNVYRYIPTIKEAMKKTDMYEAGLAYVIPTKETFEILKWSVFCALEEYCILPYYAPLHDCYKSANSITPTCHRFDQSVINVLLFNANNYNLQNYTSGITNFFVIRRGIDSIPNFGLLQNC